MWATAVTVPFALAILASLLILNADRARAVWRSLSPRARVGIVMAVAGGAVLLVTALEAEPSRHLSVRRWSLRRLKVRRAPAAPLISRHPLLPTVLSLRKKPSACSRGGVGGWAGRRMWTDTPLFAPLCRFTTCLILLLQGWLKERGDVQFRTRRVHARGCDQSWLVSRVRKARISGEQVRRTVQRAGGWLCVAGGVALLRLRGGGGGGGDGGGWLRWRSKAKAD
jgi:hypothetical protein